MAHDHAPGRGHGPDRSTSKRSLRVAICLTGAFMVAEVIGGLVSGSLALLADAAHMLSDFASLGFALVAIGLAERLPTPNRSFGYQRAEILAALLNGATLVLISIWIFYEAWGRLREPEEVLGTPMLVVAVIGLVVNIAAAWVLSRGHEESLNVSAALRHVLADLAGSVGVIAASIVILTTGWWQADPIFGALIGALVLFSAWPIIRDSVRILLEQAPAHIDAPEVGRAILGTPGVVQAHDLHIWTITSGFPALSVHVLVELEQDCHERRRELELMLRERFEIDHTTIQVDHQEPSPLLQVAVAPAAAAGPTGGPKGNISAPEGRTVASRSGATGRDR